MRLSIPDEGELSESQGKLRDAVVGSRKGLGAEIWGRGPFGVWQNAPNVGHPALDLRGPAPTTTASVQCGRAHVGSSLPHSKRAPSPNFGTQALPTAHNTISTPAL